MGPPFILLSSQFLFLPNKKNLQLLFFFSLLYLSLLYFSHTKQRLSLTSQKVSPESSIYMRITLCDNTPHKAMGRRKRKKSTPAALHLQNMFPYFQISPETTYTYFPENSNSKIHCRLRFIFSTNLTCTCPNTFLSVHVQPVIGCYLQLLLVRFVITKKKYFIHRI